MKGYTFIVEHAKPKAAGGPAKRRFQVYIESDDRSWSSIGTIVLTWQSGKYMALDFEYCMSRELLEAIYQRFSEKEFPAISNEIEHEANKLPVWV